MKKPSGLAICPEVTYLEYSALDQMKFGAMVWVLNFRGGAVSHLQFLSRLLDTYL